jgi:hypothetical protein
VKLLDANLRWPSMRGVVLVVLFAAAIAAVHHFAIGGEGTEGFMVAVLAGAMAAECGLSVRRSPKASLLVVCLLAAVALVAWSMVPAA